MKKYPLETHKIAEHTVRYTLKLQGDTNVSPLAALVQFFKDLEEQPLLLKCGPLLPENINIRYDGEVWVLTGTAEQQLDMTQVMIEENEDINKPAKVINPFAGKLGL